MSTTDKVAWIAGICSGLGGVLYTFERLWRWTTERKVYKNTPLRLQKSTLLVFFVCALVMLAIALLLQKAHTTARSPAPLAANLQNTSHPSQTDKSSPLSKPSSKSQLAAPAPEEKNQRNTHIGQMRRGGNQTQLTQRGNSNEQTQATQSGDGNQQTQVSDHAVVQTMKDSPGGVQATGDVNIYGDLPKPARIIRRSDVAAATAILQQAPQGSAIYFISQPSNAPEGSETSNLLEALARVFRNAGWMTYRDTDTKLGTIINSTDFGDREFHDHGEGIGCTPGMISGPVGGLAMKALDALHQPCHHAATIASFLNRLDPERRFSLFVSVGTRIHPED